MRLVQYSAHEKLADLEHVCITNNYLEWVTKIVDVSCEFSTAALTIIVEMEYRYEILRAALRLNRNISIQACFKNIYIVSHSPKKSFEPLNYIHLISQVFCI